MYVFFAAVGGISRGEVLWPTIVVAVLAVLFLVRSLAVRHELAAGGGHMTARAVNSLGERRGLLSSRFERLALGPLLRGRSGEVGRCNAQVVIERPIDEALAAAGADHRTLQARGELGKHLLGAEHPAELPLVPVDELGVVRSAASRSCWPSTTARSSSPSLMPK